MANLLSTSVYGFLCSAKEESGRRVISFKSGESGWRIKNDGDSEFNRVYARIELATKSLVFGENDNEINARDYGNLYIGFRNTNQVFIGNSCNVGIGMIPQYKLDVDGDVRSRGFFQAGNYASGWTGNGCRMEAGGKMECTSLWVRGTMNVYELIINQVSATNGSFAVSDSGKVAAVSGYKITLTGDNNNFNTFRLGDLLKCQKYTGKIVKMYILYVEDVNGLDIEFLYYEGGLGINRVEPGDTLVRWDSLVDDDRSGLLYLTSSDSGAPYMDVMKSQFTYLRVGNLSGIGRLSGYGIVGRDADLNNVFYISSDSKANIAGWKFDKDALWVGDKQTLSAFTNSGITFSSSGAIRTMSFRSEPNGYTVLGKGNQSIAYNASNGKIEFGSDVSLNWKAPIDSLGDKVSNQGIDINDIGGSLNSLSSVVGTKTTYIDANGIYTGTLTADQVNAINVRGESLSFVKGTIAGLRFSNNALWAGNDEINDTFTGIVFGKDVSLNGVEKTGLFGVKKGITTFSLDAGTGDFEQLGYARKIETYITPENFKEYIRWNGYDYVFDFYKAGSFIIINGVFTPEQEYEMFRVFVLPSIPLMPYTGEGIMGVRKYFGNTISIYNECNISIAVTGNVNVSEPDLSFQSVEIYPGSFVCLTCKVATDSSDNEIVYWHGTVGKMR